MSQIKKIFIILAVLFLVFPMATNAVCFPSPSGLAQICIGGSSSGSGSLSQFGLPSGTIFGIIENLVYWLLGIFAFFGIIGFAVSGIMYLVSAGNDEMIGKAKAYMMYSIVGVIVGLMGVVILQAAAWMLGGSNSQF